MIWKRREAPPLRCPVCGEPSTGDAETWMDHLLAHVVPEGGGFTWSCGCGATAHSWSKDIKAAGALTVHLVRSHGYRLETPRLAAALALADGYEGIG